MNEKPNGVLAAPSTKLVVYGALAGNLLVACTKAGAAAWTGSSAMASEAIHSFVDSGNEVLLLYGLRRSSYRPDVEHPFGYGREVYFWSFIVALLVFAFGAVVSVLQGIAHIRRPETITSPNVIYVVLVLSAVFEGASWLLSLRQFFAAKGELGFFEAFRRSKDPPSFMVLFEDSAALVGITIAAIGTYLATTFGWPVMDGVASVAIGVVLAITAILLARESKSLLIGEPAAPSLTASIIRIAQSDNAVVCANGIITAQLGPDQVLAALSVEFRDDLGVPDLENAVVSIEKTVRHAHPEVVYLCVKPQTASVFKEVVRKRFGDA